MKLFNSELPQAESRELYMIKKGIKEKLNEIGEFLHRYYLDNGPFADIDLDNHRITFYSCSHFDRLESIEIFYKKKKILTFPIEYLGAIGYYSSIYEIADMENIIVFNDCLCAEMKEDITTEIDKYKGAAELISHMQEIEY